MSRVGVAGLLNLEGCGNSLKHFRLCSGLLKHISFRQSSGDLNGGKIVYTIRIANIVRRLFFCFLQIDSVPLSLLQILLVLIILLLFTGIGQYYEADGARISIWLTIDKW